MRTASPLQADLFGFRDLHTSTLPAAESEVVARLRADLRQARADLARSREERELAEQRSARLAAEVMRLHGEVANLRLRPGTCQLPKPTWRLLMQLCHPDKHEGSAAALAAAKWLNENKPE